MATQSPDDNSKFAAELLDDIQALAKLVPQTEHLRRAIARAIFAAIDGYLHLVKAHIHTEAAHLLSHAETAFLRGESFAINSKGVVETQRARIAFATDVRFTVAVIRKLHPESTASVGEEGWRYLKLSLGTRSRIVHPKSVADLAVSDADIMGAIRGFIWLVKLTGHSFAAMEFVTNGKRDTNAKKAVAMIVNTAEYIERAMDKLQKPSAAQGRKGS